MPMYTFVCSHTACGEMFPGSVYMSVYRFSEQKRIGFPGVECPQCGANRPRSSMNHDGLAPRDITPRGEFGRTSSPGLKGQSFYGKAERDRMMASAGTCPADDDSTEADTRSSEVRVFKYRNGAAIQVAGPKEDDGSRRLPTSEVEKLVFNAVAASEVPLRAADVHLQVSKRRTASIGNVRKALQHLTKAGDLIPPLARPERGLYALNPSWVR